MSLSWSLILLILVLVLIAVLGHGIWNSEVTAVFDFLVGVFTGGHACPTSAAC